MTVRGLGGALRRDSVSLAGHFAYQWGTADWGDPDTLRVYGPAGGAPGAEWLTAGPVAAGEAVEAVWFRVAGVPFAAAHPLAPAGAHPFAPLCAYPAQGVFNAGDGLAQGNTGPVRIEASLLADAGPGAGLVITPDTLGRGGEAALALPPEVPVMPSMPVTLLVEDPAYGGFVTVAPASARAPGASPPQPYLATTVGALPSVRFRVADDAPLGTVGLAAAFDDGTTLKGTLTVMPVDSLSVSLQAATITCGSASLVEVEAWTGSQRAWLPDTTSLVFTLFGDSDRSVILAGLWPFGLCQKPPILAQERPF